MVIGVYRCQSLIPKDVAFTFTKPKLLVLSNGQKSRHTGYSYDNSNALTNNQQLDPMKGESDLKKNSLSIRWLLKSAQSDSAHVLYQTDNLRLTEG